MVGDVVWTSPFLLQSMPAFPTLEGSLEKVAKHFLCPLPQSVSIGSPNLATCDCFLCLSLIHTLMQQIFLEFFLCPRYWGNIRERNNIPDLWSS